jgi:DNA end-binding protein Ku
VPEYGKTDNVKLKPQEIKLAEELVKSLSVDFKPEEYRDDYQARLKELIDAKLKGKEVTAAPKPHLAPVIDMMAALKKSLAATKSGAKKDVHAVEPSAHKRALRKIAS